MRQVPGGDHDSNLQMTDKTKITYHFYPQFGGWLNCMRQYLKQNHTMRLMRYILIILAFTGCQTVIKKSNKIYVKQIICKYVDFSIETVIDINCDDFERQFSDKMETVVINDSNQINKILSLINSLKIAGKEYYQHVDTRMKAQMKYNNDSSESICVGNFIVNRDNNIYIRTDSLTQLLMNK